MGGLLGGGNSNAAADAARAAQRQQALYEQQLREMQQQQLASSRQELDQVAKVEVGGAANEADSEYSASQRQRRRQAIRDSTLGF